MAKKVKSVSESIVRPMLAETGEMTEVKFPVLASPKLDGIRCVIVGGKALSRKFKPIPNTFIREWLEANCQDGLDGELMVPGLSFNEIQSAVMREDGEPSFEFHVFDYAPPGGLGQPFYVRYLSLSDLALAERIKIVPHPSLKTAEELIAYEETCVAAGYEGTMVRDPNGPYKCGRSTLNEGWLLKIKRFADSEAEILGFEELQTNNNPKEMNELGLSKRSSKKDGKVGAGMLGKFKVRDVKTKMEFDIGTGDGLTKELRQEIWDNRDSYLGKLVKYKYQPSGQKELPRFPVWIGFRDERDM